MIKNVHDKLNYITSKIDSAGEYLQIQKNARGYDGKPVPFKIDRIRKSYHSVLKFQGANTQKFQKLADEICELIEDNQILHIGKNMSFVLPNFQNFRDVPRYFGDIDYAMTNYRGHGGGYNSYSSDSFYYNTQNLNIALKQEKWPNVQNDETVIATPANSNHSKIEQIETLESMIQTRNSLNNFIERDIVLGFAAHNDICMAFLVTNKGNYKSIIYEFRKRGPEGFLPASSSKPRYSSTLLTKIEHDPVAQAIFERDKRWPSDKEISDAVKKALELNITLADQVFAKCIEIIDTDYEEKE